VEHGIIGNFSKLELLGKWSKSSEKRSNCSALELILHAGLWAAPGMVISRQLCALAHGIFLFCEIHGSVKRQPYSSHSCLVL